MGRGRGRGLPSGQQVTPLRAPRRGPRNLGTTFSTSFTSGPHGLLPYTEPPRVDLYLKYHTRYISSIIPAISQVLYHVYLNNHTRYISSIIPEISQVSYQIYHHNQVPYYIKYISVYLKPRWIWDANTGTFCGGI